MSAATINIVGKVFKVESTIAGTTPIAKITIPVDTGYGERKTTTWWLIKFFGKQGESALKAIQKGDWVAVSGKASVSVWTARDGSERCSAEVDGHYFERVGPRIPRESGPPAKEEPQNVVRGQLKSHLPHIHGNPGGYTDFPEDDF